MCILEGQTCLHFYTFISTSLPHILSELWNKQISQMDWRPDGQTRVNLKVPPLSAGIKIFIQMTVFQSDAVIQMKIRKKQTSKHPLPATSGPIQTDT